MTVKELRQWLNEHAEDDTVEVIVRQRPIGALYDVVLQVLDEYGCTIEKLDGIEVSK